MTISKKIHFIEHTKHSGCMMYCAICRESLSSGGVEYLNSDYSSDFHLNCMPSNIRDEYYKYILVKLLEK